MIRQVIQVCIDYYLYNNHQHQQQTDLAKLIMACYNHRYMYMYFKTKFLPSFTFEFHHPKSKTKLNMFICLGRIVFLTFPSITPFVITMSNSGTHHGFTEEQTPSPYKLCTLHDNTLSLQTVYIT